MKLLDRTPCTNEGAVKHFRASDVYRILGEKGSAFLVQLRYSVKSSPKLSLS